MDDNVLLHSQLPRRRVQRVFSSSRTKKPHLVRDLQHQLPAMRLAGLQLQPVRGPVHLPQRRLPLPQFHDPVLLREPVPPLHKQPHNNRLLRQCRHHDLPFMSLPLLQLRPLNVHR